jgi:hypothetical protein
MAKEPGKDLKREQIDNTDVFLLPNKIIINKIIKAITQ